MESVIGLISGILGAVLGAALTWIASTRHSQAATAFDMHREYHSQQMVVAREQGGRLASLYSGLDFATLWHRLSPDQAQCLWNVIYFYERLWMAVCHKYVRPSLVPELFGDSFHWWYVTSFERQLLPLGDPTARHIADLHSWMLSEASQEQRAGWADYVRTWEHGKGSGDAAGSGSEERLEAGAVSSTPAVPPAVEGEGTPDNHSEGTPDNDSSQG